MTEEFPTDPGEIDKVLVGEITLVLDRMLDYAESGNREFAGMLREEIIAAIEDLTFRTPSGRIGMIAKLRRALKAFEKDSS